MKVNRSNKEVYLKLPETSLTNIKRSNKKKNIILRNKKFNNTLIRYKKNKKNIKKTHIKKNKNTSYKKKLDIERKQQRKNRRNKSIRKKHTYNKKLSSKISFNMDKNITKEYHCKQLNGYESDYDNDDNDDRTSNKEFKIEEMPEIDISNYI